MLLWVVSPILVWGLQMATPLTGKRAALRGWGILGLLALLATVGAACGRFDSTPTVTPTAIATATPAPTPTATAVPIATATPTITAVPTLTPTPRLTPTPTPTPTATPEPLTAAELLAIIRENLEKTETLRVKLTGRLQQGDVAFPFKLDGVMELPSDAHGTFLLQGQYHEFIRLNGEDYIALPGRGFIEDNFASSGAVFLELLDPILNPDVSEPVTDLERHPDVTIEGWDLHHISYRMDARKFVSRLADQDLTVVEIKGRVDLFINKANMLPQTVMMDCKSCLLPVFLTSVDLVADFAFSGFGTAVFIPSPDVPHIFIPTVESDDHGNVATDATPLVLEETALGDIEPQLDVDFFVFETVAGQAYSITVTLRTLDDSTLTLYDTDGTTVLGFSDDYGATTASRIAWVAPRSDRYYASVAGFNRLDFGSYAVTLGIWVGFLPTPGLDMPTPTRTPRPTSTPAPTATAVPTPTPTVATALPGGSAEGQFAAPLGIAVDGVGNVYVADNQNHRIQKFSTSGDFLETWGSEGAGNGQFQFPGGVTVDGAGSVYVTDANNHRIQVFSSDGTFLRAWGSEGVGEGQFNIPTDVAVDESGNVYVVDFLNHRVQVFNANGAFLRTWGSEGSEEGQFSFPDGVAIDAAGSVYVTDQLNNRVQVFNANGAFLRAWGSEGIGEGQFGGVHHIAIEGTGSVYVADLGNHRIQVFSSTGTFLRMWGSHGNDDGQFFDPHGIAVDDAGRVYVADAGNNRVQMFSSGGEFLDTWG